MRKKIVHIITGLNDGGAEGVLFRLCLNAQNNSHIVISLMDKGKYGPVLERSGITVHCLGMHPARPSIKRFFRLIRMIHDERPDLVQTWMYHGDLLGGIAAKLAGVKRVLWGVRHSTLEKGKSKRSTILIARICALLSGFLPERIICCAQEAALVHASIGYSSSKLEVIPNGYDFSRFRPDENLRNGLRQELGLGPDKFVVGLVARFDPQKDHENLLNALSHVASKTPFRCLLVGTGMSADNTFLVQKLSDLGLTERVHLSGPRTDIPAIMNAMDLHVLSSAYGEAFPNVIAEAMACGTPAGSTDVGDAGEIVGDPALLCPPRNPKALSELILAMHAEWLERPDDWAARRIGCVEHIKNNFSIERMVAAYEQCWFGD